MIDSINVNKLRAGDRVWVLTNNRLLKEMVFRRTSENGLVLFGGVLNSIWAHKDCFPTLDALLQHLKDTAIYYKETNA